MHRSTLLFGKVVLIVFMTAVLLIATSFIPLKGHYVYGAAVVGDALYRDDRGMPLVFLKRSLADGECEVANQQSQTCLPTSKTFAIGDQHELSLAYFGLDFAFWMIISTAMLLIYTKLRKPTATHSPVYDQTS